MAEVLQCFRLIMLVNKTTAKAMRRWVLMHLFHGRCCYVCCAIPFRTSTLLNGVGWKRWPHMRSSTSGHESTLKRWSNSMRKVSLTQVHIQIWGTKLLACSWPFFCFFVCLWLFAFLMTSRKTWSECDGEFVRSHVPTKVEIGYQWGWRMARRVGWHFVLLQFDPLPISEFYYWHVLWRWNGFLGSNQEFWLLGDLCNVRTLIDRSYQTRYLKTHPANPEQLQTKLADITWLTAIRLARNIICHERNFNWNGLKELKSHMLSYFGSTLCLHCHRLTYLGSMEAISQMFELYRTCCSGTLEDFKDSELSSQDALFARVHSPAAHIQISPHDSAIITTWEDPGMLIGHNGWLTSKDSAIIFVGLETTHYHVERWLKLSSRSRLRQNFVFTVYGGQNCGKTTVAKYVIPHILNSLTDGLYSASYIDLAQSSKKGSGLCVFYMDMLQALTRRGPVSDFGGQHKKTSQEKVTQILSSAQFQYHVIVLDSFDFFFRSLTDAERVSRESHSN